jgi:hypothetical protein
MRCSVQFGGIIALNCDVWATAKFLWATWLLLEEQAEDWRIIA